MNRLISPLRAAAAHVLLGLVAMPTFVSDGFAQQTANPVKQHFQFKDVGKEAGLFPALAGIHGHAAGWGDADGNGWPDLYVGTFHSQGPSNRLLLNEQGKFRPAEQPDIEISTRATGTLLVDLDNDGDADLYVSSMPIAARNKKGELRRPMRGCSLFRNDGNGKFTDISRENGACPTAFGGRSACVLDFDGDGLLDLLVGEEPITGYNGSATRSSRLFRNLGNLRFEDVSRQAGLPEDIPGLGVAAGDVNNDSWPDFLIACQDGGNRLFLNDGTGKFSEAPGSKEMFHWPAAGGDNMVCGVCFGDVNRDGLLDIVLGQHFKRPWIEPVANRLYLNRGIEDGVPRFEDVTEKVGLTPLELKAPHVEIRDFDNDGWPDIYTSIVKFADGRAHPVIFKHMGIRDGLPRFEQTALAVNDFPTEADRATTRTGEFFNQMIAEGKIVYMAPGPSTDFDRDGRLDLFLPNWWTEAPSLLLRNETDAGNWIQLQVAGGEKMNRMGIGARVNVYRAGQLGTAQALLGSCEVAIGYGYASAQEPVVQIGLGTEEKCDVEVVLPHGLGRRSRENVQANQRITLP